MNLEIRTCSPTSLLNYLCHSDLEVCILKTFTDDTSPSLYKKFRGWKRFGIISDSKVSHKWNIQYISIEQVSHYKTQCGTVYPKH